MSVTTLAAQQELSAPEVKMDLESKLMELNRKLRELSEQISSLEKTKELEDNAELNVQVSFVINKFDLSGIGYRFERSESISGFVRLYLSEISHFIRETHITERGVSSDTHRICISKGELELRAKEKVLSILLQNLPEDEEISESDLHVVSVFAPIKDSLSRKIDLLDIEVSSK